MAEVNFQDVMAETAKAVTDNGLDFRGKKYLEVAKRVEIFRKHYGTDGAILTDIVEMGRVRGEAVAMRAAIQVDGKTVAVGHASEVVGEGNVNRSSALENAETSAIGRALAALGIHGGEYASANEMARIGEKPENPTAEALLDAWEQAAMDALPDDPSPETLASAYADMMEEEVTRYKSENGVIGYMRKHSKHLDFIQEHAPERHGPLRAAAFARIDELKQGKAA